METRLEPDVSVSNYIVWPPRREARLQNVATVVLREAARLSCIVQRLLDRQARSETLTGALGAWSAAVETVRKRRRDAFVDAMGEQMQAAKRCRLGLERHALRRGPLRSVMASWRGEVRLARERSKSLQRIDSAFRRSTKEMSSVMSWQILSAWHIKVCNRSEPCKARIHERDSSRDDTHCSWTAQVREDELDDSNTLADGEYAITTSEMFGEPVSFSELFGEINRWAPEDRLTCVHSETPQCTEEVRPEEGVLSRIAQAPDVLLRGHAGSRSAGACREDLQAHIEVDNSSTTQGGSAASNVGSGASSRSAHQLASSYSSSFLAPSSPPSSTRVTKSFSAGRLMPWEIAPPQASACASGGASTPVKSVPITTCSTPRWLVGSPPSSSTVRGPERFFYDTSSYTGCARHGAASSSGREGRGIVFPGKESSNAGQRIEPSRRNLRSSNMHVSSDAGLYSNSSTPLRRKIVR